MFTKNATDNGKEYKINVPNEAKRTQIPNFGRIAPMFS